MAGKQTETKPPLVRREPSGGAPLPIEVDADITRASTLPAAAYSDPAY